jgi:hypothetical protein
MLDAQSEKFQWSFIINNEGAIMFSGEIVANINATFFTTMLLTLHNKDLVFWLPRGDWGHGIPCHHALKDIYVILRP